MTDWAACGRSPAKATRAPARISLRRDRVIVYSSVVIEMPDERSPFSMSNYAYAKVCSMPQYLAWGGAAPEVKPRDTTTRPTCTSGTLFELRSRLRETLLGASNKRLTKNFYDGGVR